MSSRKCEILHLIVSFILMGYLPRDLRVMESLKKINSENFTSMGSFLSNVYEVWAKKIQRSYLLWHWTVMQNLNKLWPCGFENRMRNLVDFHKSPQKSEKLWIDGLFLSKAYVSARKLQRNYVSWHWRVMENLKKNWLVVWKMT